MLEKLLKNNNLSLMNLAVVGAQSKEVFESVYKSFKLKIANPILIGDTELIKSIGEEMDIDLSSFEMIDEKDLSKASKIAVQLVNEKKADYIMKGIVETSTLLREVLNRDYGLRTDSLLSHVMVYETPNYHKLLYLTDGGMNIEPNVDEKEKIIKNVGIVAKSFGHNKVKVALLAAKEKVDKKMKATLDAEELMNRYNNGNFPDYMILEGPISLDLALSKESAAIKGYESKISGDTDVLLVPNIEMGNGIGKTITYLSNGKSAGIVMGAKVPIVLVSRSDDPDSKLFSIGLGSIISRQNTPK